MEFNLEQTLRSGQFFQWKPDGESFVVRSGAVTARLRQSNGDVDVDGADRAWAHRLFALDHPLGEIRDALGRDERLRPALEHGAGVRVMRQDPWECLLGFMLSSVSNIPRIQRQIWAFDPLPRPHEVRDLSRLRAGFRARYIAEAARRVDDAWFESIRTLDDDAARERLMSLPGVGRKIANCVLLYAYERLGAFPVDVWIRRAMRRLARRRLPDEAYEAMARRRWGRWAGYAQLYLYAATRHGR